MKVYLSVIIPCYNEELRFEDGFTHYYSYLKKRKYLWEIIFVNDGSTDKTDNLLSKYSKLSKSIKKISYKKNRGKGYAIIQGVKAARGKYILFSDIDHSVSIKTIKGFFQHFSKGYDVVIGSRRVKGAKFLKRQPFFREFLGKVFSFLVRVLIDWQIRDTTCGFKAFDQKIAKKIFQKITVYNWAFDAEVLFLCKKYNIDYVQAPVTWRDVRGSKVSIGKDVARSIYGLLKIRINDVQNKY